MTPRLVTAPVGTYARRGRADAARHQIEKLPVVDDDGSLRGLITVKDIFKRRSIPVANKDEHGRLRVAAPSAPAPDDLDRARALLGCGCDVLVIDSAHGHSDGVLKGARPGCGRRSRTRSSSAATWPPRRARGPSSSAGSDAVKVGIGPGSICTTRVVTGVGVPQITAIIDAVAGRRRRPGHRGRRHQVLGRRREGPGRRRRVAS